MRTRGFTIAAAGVRMLFFTAALTGCQTEGTDTRRGDEGNSIDLSRREKAAEQPDPSLSPQEVVKIQLHALKNNDEADNGIRTAFTFASPGNQATTGPLDRFIILLKGPLYGEMLNYVSEDLGPMIVRGDSAQQEVTLTTPEGLAARYTFLLSRQSLGRLKGCWLTDGVLRENPAKEEGRLRAELDLQLDSLFEKLRSTSDPGELDLIEERIWQNWMQSGDADIDDLLEQGTAALENGDFEAAIRLFDLITDTKPDFAEAWNKRATVYYLEGDFEASLEDIENTLALERRHFGALSGLSLIYSALGDDARALSALESVHEIYPLKAGLKERIEELKAKLGIRST